MDISDAEARFCVAALNHAANEFPQAREALIDVPHPRWGTVKMQNSFPKFSKTPGGVRRRAPDKIGQDNYSVYRDALGLSDAEIKHLETRGII